MTPTDFQDVTLGQLCSLRAGAAFKPKLQGRSTGLFPFIKVSDFSLPANAVTISEANNWVAQDDTASIAGRPFPSGTVVFAKIGEALKHNRKRVITRPTYIDNNLMGAIPQPGVVHPAFLLHLFRTIDIGAANVGTAIPYVKAGTLQKLPLRVPSLDVQVRIAEVLGAYDDLIEVNKRRVSLLEGMAQGLFEEWFVRFRFPGADSADIESPAGWSRTKVGDVLKKFRRPIKVQRQDYLVDGLVPCVDQSVKFIGGYTNNLEALIKDPLPICVFGDHTRIVKYVNFPFASGADGTQLLFPIDGLSPEYLYFALMGVDLSNQHYARHFKFLKTEEIWRPAEAVVDRFTSITRPLLGMAQNLRFQGDKIAWCRDLLLPRLISGQLSVAEGERELALAA